MTAHKKEKLDEAPLDLSDEVRKEKTIKHFKSTLGLDIEYTILEGGQAIVYKAVKKNNEYEVKVYYKDDGTAQKEWDLID
jgi:hypothetical protein